MKNLLVYNHKIYTQEDLILSLTNLGIKKGDIIYMHSEIYNFGIPLLPIAEFLNALLECFFKIIGNEGTLVMPTFTYSFCKNEIYDKINSKCTVGALNEFFRKQNGVKRTNDPIFSFAIKGAKEELFLKDSKTCFGENSVYDELTKNNAKGILFGGKKLGFTYFHHIEEMANIGYRYPKIFKGTMINEQGEKHQKEISYFVRDLEKHTIIDRDRIFDFFAKNHLIETEKFGGAEIVALDLKAIYHALLSQIKQDETFLLTEHKG